MTHRVCRFVPLLLALGALACGHKSPPLPPPLTNPAATTDLRAQQRGDELILEFTYPLTTVSGLPLTKIEKVEYWELVKPLSSPEDEVGEEEAEGQEEGEDAPQEAGTEGDEDETGDEPDATVAEDADSTESAGEEAETGSEEEVVPLGAPLEGGPLPPPPTKEQLAAVEFLEFAATAQIRLVLEAEELTAATVGEKIVLRLPFAAPADEDTGYIYSVKTFSDARRVSNWSNLAVLVRREPPPAPTEFTVEPMAGGVMVKWFNQKARDREEAMSKASEEGEPPPPPPPALTDEERQDSTIVKSYRIYRRDAQARTYGEHVGQTLSVSGEFLDRTAQYGSRYIYALSAVGLFTPVIESAFAGEIEVDYQDRFAPPAPLNPVALAEPGRVRVLWDASPAPDLRGYLVFRREAGATEFTQLNQRPIVDLEFNDREVAPGTTYEYQVAAIDRIGNEGEPGMVVTARVP